MLIVSHSRNQVALPLASIARAIPIEGGWLVTDSLGQDHKVDKVSWDIAIEGTPTAMMPALPGTYLIGLWDDEGEEKIWKQNVLGWMVCADGGTRPVVLDQEALLSAWYVLQPDGRVENATHTWESLEEWRASYNADLRTEPAAG